MNYQKEPIAKIREILNTCEPSYFQVSKTDIGKSDKQVVKWVEAEVKETDSFDWWKELRNPIMNRYDWQRLEDLASNWITCACGNQCSIIPRNNVGNPVDEQLSNLGAKFYNNIYYCNKIAARKTLYQIERRSAFLIQQIRDDQNKD